MSPTGCDDAPEPESEEPDERDDRGRRGEEVGREGPVTCEGPARLGLQGAQQPDEGDHRADGDEERTGDTEREAPSELTEGRDGLLDDVATDDRDRLADLGAALRGTVVRGLRHGRSFLAAGSHVTGNPTVAGYRATRRARDRSGGTTPCPVRAP